MIICDLPSLARSKPRVKKSCAAAPLENRNSVTSAVRFRELLSGLRLNAIIMYGTVDTLRKPSSA